MRLTYNLNYDDFFFIGLLIYLFRWVNQFYRLAVIYVFIFLSVSLLSLFIHLLIYEGWLFLQFIDLAYLIYLVTWLLVYLFS